MLSRLFAALPAEQIPEWVRVNGRARTIRDFVFAPAPEETRHDDLTLTREQDLSWGWFPHISFAGSLCLLLIAFGLTGTRQEMAVGELAFWVGILSFFCMISYRIISPSPSRRERIGLLMLLGIGLYMVKIMHSPLYFTFYDELQHFRTASDILETRHLFHENSLLPVSPLYPGLENITVALANLTGLDIFESGLIVILVARVVFMLILFLFYEKASLSPRLAAIATMIYAANPHFIFFDAQYGYESMAIVFAVTVLFGIEYRLHQHLDRPAGATLLIVFALGATMITHHVTSYFLLICLTLWTLVIYFRGRSQHRTLLFGTMLLAIVSILSWMMYVASITIDYLVPVVSGAVLDLVKVLLREEAGRQLFSGQGDGGVRFYEQIIVYLGTIFIMLGLMVGGIVMWREHRRQSTYFLLAIIGMLYPVTQLLRFSEKGPELASRIGPFMFIGIAFVMAAGMVKLYPSEYKNRIKQFGFAFIIMTIFWGDVLVSFPRWALLPGEYLASADTRSIEEQGIETAQWTRQYLGEDNLFAADRINGLLLLAHGHQQQITGSNSEINVPGIFLDIPFSAVEYATICAGQIRYVLTDYRLTRHLPMLGHYYETQERNDNNHREPLDPSLFRKFDVQPQFSRVFDSGNYVIYQVDLSLCER